jgi:5-dehydro-2-deoxygluconokinase
VSDIVIAGRICIDLYPQQAGVPLQEVTSFGKSVAGSATNVAVAAARHGERVTLLTRTGDDPFGDYAVQQLRRYGIDTRYTAKVPGLHSVLTFCEMFPPDDFPLYIWRSPTAPDMYLDPADLPLELIVGAPVFWATATGLSREPSRSAHLAAWRARGRTRHTVLDLDYRPVFWDDPQEAHRAIDAALDHVTIAIGNIEECAIAVGETDPLRAADALLGRGIELAIVKQGSRGVLAKTAGETVEVPPFPVDVLNGLGAGDAFGGALCHGLLAGWDLERTLRFANAAGAIVATRFECSSAMPTTAEVEAFLARRSVQA